MARRDVVILGGGPAGTAAAVAARRAGLDVVLVERGWRSTRRLAERALAEELWLRPLSGAPVERRVDAFRAAVRRAGEVAAALGDRRSQLLSRAGVTRLLGWARFTGEAGEVEVASGENAAGGEAVAAGEAVAGGTGAASVERVMAAAGQTPLRADRVLLTAGSRPAAPRECTVEEGSVSSRDSLLDLDVPPDSALVVGGGREGVGLAGLLASAGSVVTLVEAASRVLPEADADLSAAVGRALEAAGAKLLLGHRVTALAIDRGVTVATMTTAAAGVVSAPLAAACAFATTGNEPALEGFGLERLGVHLEIPMPENAYRTGLDWLFVAGAASGRSLSPEAARREGRSALASMLGKPEPVPYRAVPVVIVGAGGCGWAGDSEQEARSAGHSVLVGRSRLQGRGPVRPGFVKVVADRGSGRVLGVHVAGGQGREAVALGAAAVELGMSREDLAAMAFPVGSPAEALAQAASEAEPS